MCLGSILHRIHLMELLINTKLIESYDPQTLFEHAVKQSK